MQKGIIYSRQYCQPNVQKYIKVEKNIGSQQYLKYLKSVRIIDNRNEETHLRAVQN